ncbi:DUF2027 domain-containing protein [Cytophagaceae bacterium ABcell3]|nr:DUF2027 domain-containing protein [Cytophagaceae bacterium ABcell3]
MRPGTKVRLLHGKEQGIVRNIKEGNLVEVEIEDGFIIPVMKKELVVVSEEESVSFSARDEDVTIPDTPSGHDEGIYLAYIPFNDRVFHQYIINNTGHEILFTLHEQNGFKFNGSYSGLISRKSSIKTGERDVSRFDEWPTMIFQALFYNVKPGIVNEPLVKKLQPTAKSFYKHKRLSPILNKEGHVFQIDESVKEVDPNKLKEALSEKQQQEKIRTERPPSEVDLHIDQLLKKPGVTTGVSILDIQLREFEKYLENAIASEMKQITFIHGVGNGTLKNKIHNHLKKHKQVKSFSEARPDKFGYGATLVIFY